MELQDDHDDRPLYLQRLFPRRSSGRLGSPAAPPLPPEAAGPYARKALTEELDKLAHTPEGERNHQLNIAGFNLSQLVAGGYLPHDDVWHALRTTALDVGLTSTETEATLRSSFDGGMRQPRQVADVGGYQAPPATVLHLAPSNGAQPNERDQEEEQKELLRKRFTPVDWVKLWADETVDEWIAEPLIPARRLVALFSPPKMGKSLLMLELAVLVSRGMPVLGGKLERAYRVLYVDFENDPRGDVRQRLKAMGYGPHHLDNLFYLSFPQLAYLDTYVGGLELLAIAQLYEVDLVVIDTISRAVQGEENDNDTWLGFYRNTGVRLKAAGIACIRLDHTGKDTSKGMRGGSAKYGDVDAVWSMTQQADDTFRLECTDNRLPIAEKRLTIKREVGPLKHVVDTNGREGLVLRCIATLDAMGVDVHKPYRDVRTALADAGHMYAKHVSDEAQRRRRSALPAPTTLEDA